MNISFNGFGENILTFEADAALVGGATPVKFTSEGKVAPCEEGDKICGVAVNVRDGFAAVQLAGYVELPSTGTIEAGFNTVVATADGKVAVDENGKEVLVVSVGTDTVGFIL